jgi:hypothetical protein
MRVAVSRGMQNTRFLGRREFTADAVLAMLSGVAILISEAACGGGSTSPMSPAPLPPTGDGSDKVGQISTNHGHSAVVTAAQLLAGNQVQLDIRGQADHTHFVTLAQDALQNIAAGKLVATDSTTTSGHAHTVTFNPATPDPGSGPGY